MVISERKLLGDRHENIFLFLTDMKTGDPVYLL